MTNRTSVFIGGKQIGANCLRELLARGAAPAFVVPNLDDTGEATWHESTARIAEAASIPVLRNKKVRDSDVVERIRAARPDIIFCIGGMQIIPKEVLEIPSQGTLNIHPAPLPKYRGRFSTAHAIFNGEKTHGVTIHWMDEGIDSGPIIMQETFPIADDDTGKTLYDKFTEVGTSMFQKFLKDWLNGAEIVAVPQDESQATYYPKGLPGDGAIDWSWSGEQIRNWIRAMTFPPFPPPDFLIGETPMVIVEKKYFTGFE